MQTCTCRDLYQDSEDMKGDQCHRPTRSVKPPIGHMRNFKRTSPIPISVCSLFEIMRLV